MAIFKNDKNKEYSRYAAHCFHVATMVKDQESCAIQHKMAAEWLTLADAVLHPLERQQVQMS